MSTLLLKRRADAGIAPVPADLGPGELAINTADGKLFYKSASGLIMPVPLTDLAQLAKVLRVDGGAQSIAAAYAALSRFNLGRSAPLKISAAQTGDPQLSFQREMEFMGAFTWTAPASTDIFDGWTTGVFHNRGNGSITTATFLGTIGVPNGAYLDGVLNGTRTIAFGQRGYLYYDASATPNPTWRWSWIDRAPILTIVNAPAGTTAFDISLPVGYQDFEFSISNFVPSANGNTLQARLSADKGSTFRQGGSDYTEVYSGWTSGGSGFSGTAIQQSYMDITFSQQTASFIVGPAARSKGLINAKYGSVSIEESNTGANYQQYRISAGQSSPSDVSGAGAVITPNLIRFYCAVSFSCNGWVRGVPSS